MLSSLLKLRERIQKLAFSYFGVRVLNLEKDLCPKTF